MGTKKMLVGLCAVVLSAGALMAADDLKPIPLPKPQTEGGKPLMQALKERQTSREFSPRKLPDQVLSNLLWAAFGVNRGRGGGDGAREPAVPAGVAVFASLRGPWPVGKPVSQTPGSFAPARRIRSHADANAHCIAMNMAYRKVGSGVRLRWDGVRRAEPSRGEMREPI